ncbi:MAG TPA: hypothetical protein VFE48_25460 [Methylomirabilota bacterium]|nr:hypothetical protein [Methylomirabilota bacterium]
MQIQRSTRPRAYEIPSERLGLRFLSPERPPRPARPGWFRRLFRRRADRVTAAA